MHIEEDAQYSWPHKLGTIKILADRKHIIALELLKTILPDPQIPQCETCALSKMKTPTIPQKKT
jgi:hypothetical protein